MHIRDLFSYLFFQLNVAFEVLKHVKRTWQLLILLIRAVNRIQILSSLGSINQM